MGIFNSGGRKPLSATLFQPGRDMPGGFGKLGTMNGMEPSGLPMTGVGRNPFFNQNPGPPGYMGGRGIGDGHIELMQGQQMEAEARPPMIGQSSPSDAPTTLGRSLFAPPSIDGSAMAFEGVKPSNPKSHNGFFSKNGAWRDVAGAIGDAFGTNGPVYAQQKMQHMQMAREDAWRDKQHGWQVEDRNWKANQPDYFMSGRDRVKLNPATGEAQVVYDGLEDFDQYASSMGYEPGSDEYETAVTDYVLRGNGPTALGIDKQLDDHRTKNNQRLDDYRTGNRVKVRAQPTYRDSNPRPAATRTPRRAAAPAVTATNPATGETITVNSRGQWVDKNGRVIK